jgi:hypothetical protein
LAQSRVGCDVRDKPGHDVPKRAERLFFGFRPAVAAHNPKSECDETGAKTGGCN